MNNTQKSYLFFAGLTGCGTGVFAASSLLLLQSPSPVLYLTCALSVVLLVFAAVFAVHSTPGTTSHPRNAALAGVAAIMNISLVIATLWGYVHGPLLPILAGAVTSISVLPGIEPPTASVDPRTHGSSSLRFTLRCRPSWIAWMFHRCFTRPYARIGDQTFRTTWGTSVVEFLVDPRPTYSIAVGFFYKGFPDQRLGETAVQIDNDVTELQATLGMLNSSRFRISEKTN